MSVRIRWRRPTLGHGWRREAFCMAIVEDITGVTARHDPARDSDIRTLLETTRVLDRC